VTLPAALREVPRWVAWAVEHGFQVTLLAAILARLVHWMTVRALDPFYAHLPPGLDMNTYWNWAKEIAAGDWISGTSQTGPFYYGPLYPYFLAVLLRILGQSYDAVHAIQALIAVAPPVALWLIARRLFGKGPALATGLMTAFCAPFLFYEQILLTEGLLIAAHAGILLCLAMGQEGTGRTWLWAAGCGALSGVACWGRGNFLMAIPALAVVWLLAPSILASKYPAESETAGSRQSAIRNPQSETPNPKSKTQNRRVVGLLHTATYLLAAALLLGVTLWRNYHVSGKWVLVTNNGPTMFYLGNASDAIGTSVYPDSFKALTKRYGSQGAVPWGKELLKDAASHPPAFIRLQLKKTWMFWNSYDVADNVNYYLGKRFSWLVQCSPVNWLTLLPLAAIAVWETRKSWRRQIFLYAYTVAFALSIIVVVIIGRYRLEVLLPTLVWAGAAAANLARDAWDRRWQTVGARIAVVVAGIILLWPTWSPALALNSPKGAPGGRLVRGHDYGNLALAYIESEQTQKARGLLESVVGDYPWCPDVVFRLARIWIEAGRSDKAIPLLRNHLAGAGPDRYGLLLLAHALQRTGQETQAVEILQNLLRRNPQDADALIALQRIQGEGER
jgi:hypothetical protein